MADLFNIGFKADTRQLKTADKDLEKFGKTGTKAAKSTDGVSKSVKGLTAAVASYITVAGAISGLRTADQFQLLNDRIRLATQATGDYVKVQTDLFRISQETGTGLQNNVELFDRIRIGAQELGRSNTEVLKLVEAIDQLGASGGTSQDALGNATLQLSQALAGGILRAEEFNSIVENTPKIAQAIAEGLDTSIGGLRGMVLEGNVLADDVFNALLSQSDSIADNFEEMPIRMGRATTQFENSIMKLFGSLDEATGTTSTLAESISDLSDYIDDMSENTEGLATGLEASVKFLGGAAAAYVAYRSALIAATVAQTAFNATARANPLGLLVTTLGVAAGALYSYTSSTEDAADSVDRLMRSTSNLNDEQKALLKTTVETEILASEKRLKTINEQIQQIEALRAAETDLQKAGRSADGQDDPLIALGKNAQDAEDRIARLQEQLQDLNRTVINIGSGASSIFTQPTDAGASYYSSYKRMAASMSEATSEALTENVPEDFADALGDALASGDFSSFVNALSNQVGSAISSVVTAIGGSSILSGIAGGVAGSLASSLLSGKKKTGSSTTVGYAGGALSGFNTTNYSGLFGSSSRSEDLSSAVITQLTNSTSLAISAIDRNISTLGMSLVNGADTFSSSVKVSSEDYSGAITELTDEYVDANVAYIESLQRTNEDLVDTLARITDAIDEISSALNVAGGDTLTAAADSYVQAQSAIIEAQNSALISSLQEQAAALQEEYDNVSMSGESNSGRRRYTTLERMERANIQEEIDAINEQIAESVSRLGTGVSQASAEFAEDLLSAVSSINNIDLDSAAALLAEQASSFEDNYYSLTERVARAQQRAADELAEFSDLGIDTSTTLAEFREAFEDFQSSDAFTPEGYARWSAASVALTNFTTVLDDFETELDEANNVEALDSIVDFVRDLMGLAADGEQTLASTQSRYRAALSAAMAGDEEALENITEYANDYLEALKDAASTGLEYGAGVSAVTSDLTNLVGGEIPAFASGGSHTGGLALVGEEGPEIVNMGPSRVYSNSDSAKMFDNTELLNMISQLISVNVSGFKAVAGNTKAAAKFLERWDLEGVIIDSTDPVRVETA